MTCRRSKSRLSSWHFCRGCGWYRVGDTVGNPGRTVGNGLGCNVVGVGVGDEIGGAVALTGAAVVGRADGTAVGKAVGAWVGFELGFAVG